MSNANILSCRPASYQKFAGGAFEHLASIGVRWVEVSADPPNLDNVKAELDSHGLRAATVQGRCDLADADCAGKFRENVEFARALGANIIYVSVKAGDLDRQIAYERLRQIGDVAGEGGCVVSLETHPDLVSNMDLALATMRGVGHPAVRVNFDTANIHYYNKSIDGLAELRKIVDQLGSVHLKDTDGGYEKWFFPTFGEGIVDFKEVFAICNGAGFTGPFTMEIEGCEGDDLDEAATRKRVADSVAHLRALGCVE